MTPLQASPVEVRIEQADNQVEVAAHGSVVGGLDLGWADLPHERSVPVGRQPGGGASASEQWVTSVGLGDHDPEATLEPVGQPVAVADLPAGNADRLLAARSGR